MVTNRTFFTILGGILSAFLLSGCSEKKSTDNSVQNDESSYVETAESAPEEEQGFDITQIDGYDPTAQSTVFQLEDAPTDMWSNVLGRDYIDARTFQRDRDLRITVEYELTGDLSEMIRLNMTDLTKTQVMIAPVHADNGAKFGEKQGGLITDCPDAKALPAGGEWALSGEDVVSSKDSSVFAPVFLKANGFIKITDPALTEVSFTIPAEEVNAMIDKALSENGGFDGVSFVVGGGQKVTKVTLDEGNLYLHSALESLMKTQ